MCDKSAKITTLRGKEGIMYPRTTSDAVTIDEATTLTDEIRFLREELKTKVDYKDSVLKDVITFNDLKSVNNITNLADNNDEE